MNNLYRPIRFWIMSVLFVSILTIYVSTLAKVQIFDFAAQAAEMSGAVSTYTRTVTIPAERGDILDRNGILLVSSRPSYSLVLSREALLAAGNTNEVILNLIYLTSEYGLKYNDTFPITLGAPFDYYTDMTAPQRSRLDAYLDFFNRPRDISASDLFVWMKNHYGLDYTTGISDARYIIGVRYELELRVIVHTLAPYIFAYDVGTDFLAIVTERGYPGISIETTSERAYHTPYAAHLLGNIGRMEEKDIEYFKAIGYPMDAIVGKAGVEQAYETYLHGTEGLREITTTDKGTIVGEETIKPTAPGGNIYLTIDIDLQAATEEALASFIREQNLARDEVSKIPSGAAVVTDPRTGEVLACASYPTFDLSTFKQNYSSLAADPSSPLYDRALQGTFNPGSTFKMVTALAGLRKGVITRWTEIDDTGKYIRYDGYQPTCWLYSMAGVGHGNLNVVGALQNSCNYFFYQVGDNSGIDIIAQTAADFGFGQKTGLGVAEKIGSISSPEFKRDVLHETWYAADGLLAAIGQGHNLFTPAQLSNYAATIANGGIRRSLTLLSRVKDYNYSYTVFESVPETVYTFPDKEYIDILREGMRAAVANGTAREAFGSYPVHVSAKTGTVQVSNQNNNNGIFVCYAPSENPEIAISVVVEKGDSGGAVTDVAKMILDHYFSDENPLFVSDEYELKP